MAQRFVTNVEIPEEIAKRLSDLLTKQGIRERLLLQSVNDPATYDAIEEKLIPIATEIDALRNKITTEHIPVNYASEKYMWNYNGYAVDGNQIAIYEII